MYGLCVEDSSTLNKHCSRTAGTCMYVYMEPDCYFTRMQHSNLLLYYSRRRKWRKWMEQHLHLGDCTRQEENGAMMNMPLVLANVPEPLTSTLRNEQSCDQNDGWVNEAGSIKVHKNLGSLHDELYNGPLPCTVSNDVTLGFMSVSACSPCYYLQHGGYLEFIFVLQLYPTYYPRIIDDEEFARGKDQYRRHARPMTEI